MNKLIGSHSDSRFGAVGQVKSGVNITRLLDRSTLENWRAWPSTTLIPGICVPFLHEKGQSLESWETGFREDSLL